MPLGTCGSYHCECLFRKKTHLFWSRSELFTSKRRISRRISRILTPIFDLVVFFVVFSIKHGKQKHNMLGRWGCMLTKMVIESHSSDFRCACFFCRQEGLLDFSMYRKAQQQQQQQQHPKQETCVFPQPHSERSNFLYVFCSVFSS